MKKLVQIILGATLALFITGCSSSPGATAENFFNALLSGNVEDIKKYSTQSTQKLFINGFALKCGVNANNEDGLSKCIKKQFSKFTSCEITKEEISENNPNSASVSLKEYKKDGTSISETLNLIKKDGDWKVNATK